MKNQTPWELILALAAIAAATLGYAFLAQAGAPQPGSRVGHWLGAAGLLLMLATETLYSLRKRMPGFHFLRMSFWLRLHIFTGLVGPYLVLLHSAWKFHGLAGALTLVTLVVVVSGLVGRYIYTAVPRTLDGVEVEAAELEGRLARCDRHLTDLGVAPLPALAEPPQGSLLVLGRHFLLWKQKRGLRRAIQNLDSDDQNRGKKIYRLLAKRQRLRLQVDSVGVTRRLLALWHLFHVPLTGVLFSLAFVHVAAALYYATFLK